MNSLRSRAEPRSIAETVTMIISIIAELSAKWKERISSQSRVPMPPAPDGMLLDHRSPETSALEPLSQGSPMTAL